MLFDGCILGHVCVVTMEIEEPKIALHHLQGKKKLLVLLHPPPCLLQPCFLCHPLKMWAMREEEKRRCGCLCLDICAEPSCLPVWPSVRPGTSGTSNTQNSGSMGLGVWFQLLHSLWPSHAGAVISVCGAMWMWVAAALLLTSPWRASSNASPSPLTCPGPLWPRDSSTVCSPGSPVQTLSNTPPYRHPVPACLSTPTSLCLCVSLGLRELRVTGLSWSCLSALVSPTLPYLRLLDLRWCEGIKDAQIKEIITPSGEYQWKVIIQLLPCTGSFPAGVEVQ